MHAPLPCMPYGPSCGASLVIDEHLGRPCVRATRGKGNHASRVGFLRTVRVRVRVYPSPGLGLGQSVLHRVVLDGSRLPHGGFGRVGMNAELRHKPFENPEEPHFLWTNTQITGNRTVHCEVFAVALWDSDSFSLHHSRHHSPCTSTRNHHASAPTISMGNHHASALGVTIQATLKNFVSTSSLNLEKRAGRGL